MHTSKQPSKALVAPASITFMKCLFPCIHHHVIYVTDTTVVERIELVSFPLCCCWEVRKKNWQKVFFSLGWCIAWHACKQHIRPCVHHNISSYRVVYVVIMIIPSHAGLLSFKKKKGKERCTCLQQGFFILWLLVLTYWEYRTKMCVRTHNIVSINPTAFTG